MVGNGKSHAKTHSRLQIDKTKVISRIIGVPLSGFSNSTISRQDFANNNSILLELRQYKNDSIQSKKLPSLNFPRFFTHLQGEKKSAAISKLACFSQKRIRSYRVLETLREGG